MITDLVAVTVDAPLWATGLLVLAAFVAGRLFRRARLVEWRQRAQAAERQTALLAGREAVRESVTAEAAERALAEPTMTIAGSNLPPRGLGLDAATLAADYPPPALDPADDLDRHLAQEWADLEFRAAYRRAASPRQRADVMEDIAQTDESDDEADDPPRDEARVTSGPPFGEVAVPTVTTGAIPQVDWAVLRPVGPGYWVMPDPRLARAARALARRMQLRRPLAWLRNRLRELRAYAAARWEAAQFDEPHAGWAPGEMTAVTQDQPVVGRAVVPKPQLPRSYLPLHVWGWRMVSAAAVLGGRVTVGPAGRHRLEVVPGAVAQRQTRLLALPVGAS